MENLARIRMFQDTVETYILDCDHEGETGDDRYKCPCCGGFMIVIETFVPGSMPHHVMDPEGIDSS